MEESRWDSLAVSLEKAADSLQRIDAALHSIALSLAGIDASLVKLVALLTPGKAVDLSIVLGTAPPNSERKD